MKKLLLILALASVSHTSYCQHAVFMHLLDSRIICDKEKFTNYLTDNAYIQNGTTFNKIYSNITRGYNVSITRENSCYVTYKTNSIQEYNSIKRSVNELSTEGNHCYIHREHDIIDVDVTFMGFNTSTNEGIIKIYQNPRRRRFLVR